MITIKNINMPDSCEDCDFCINKNDYNYYGECTLQNKHTNQVYYMALHRDDDCPLIKTDVSAMEEMLKQLFPIGTIVIYNKQLFENLEKFYVLEKLKGTEVLYLIKEERKG